MPISLPVQEWIEEEVRRLEEEMGGIINIGMWPGENLDRR